MSVPVMSGTVLGVTVLRGYAPLCELARISKADVYDQKHNPTGTQRDLSPKHARNAYEYIRSSDLGYWPEVFLSVRSPEVMEYLPPESDTDAGTLKIDRVMVEQLNGIAISRVDGNHRLHYADGTHKGFPALDKMVSFCVAYGLSLEQEIILFRDINNNQRRMNTSHLDNIEARLTPEEQLKREDPALWISQELGRDKDSPLFDLVHEGGVKNSGQIVPLRTLKTGITYMFSRPTKLTDLSDPNAQYRIIKNYTQAIKRWQPQAWKNPQKYLVLRGAGLWGVCFIGADVIDRVLSQGKFDTKDMLDVLESGKSWDWSNQGDFQGLSGRGGAIKLGEMVVTEFRDESGPSMKELWQKIMQE